MNVQKKKFKEFNGDFKSTMKLNSTTVADRADWKEISSIISKYANENFKKNDYL